jgi:hypothetical protein
MSLKHTELINSLIRQRQLVTGVVTDRKTYWSSKSYKLVAQTADLRYDYAHTLLRKWPGGTIDQWVEKMPLEVRGRLIDYGRGANKMINQFRDLDSEVVWQYIYFHTIEADHFPVPKSKGGKYEFSNCVIRPKTVNVMQQNFDDDEVLKEALLTTAESRNISLDTL